MRVEEVTFWWSHMAKIGGGGGRRPSRGGKDFLYLHPGSTTFHDSFRHLGLMIRKGGCENEKFDLLPFTPGFLRSIYLVVVRMRSCPTLEVTFFLLYERWISKF